MNKKEIVIIFFVSVSAFVVIAKKLFDRFIVFRNRLKKWDKEYNDMFNQAFKKTD